LDLQWDKTSVGSKEALMAEWTVVLTAAMMVEQMVYWMAKILAELLAGL
jgi:hypothetical protein